MILHLLVGQEGAGLPHELHGRLVQEAAAGAHGEEAGGSAIRAGREALGGHLIGKVLLQHEHAVGEADLGLRRVRHRCEARVVEIAACNQPPITSQRTCHHIPMILHKGRNYMYKFL